MAIPRNPSPTIIIFFLLRLLIPCFLLPISHGQSTTNSQQLGQPSIYDFNTGFTSTTAVMIAILIVAFFFTAFFFVYIHRRRAAANNAYGNFLPATRSRTVMQAASNTGLDPAVIETFPTMVYSDVKGLKMGKSPLECAVCLCEFDEEEELTLLPKCDHAFHPQCIGMWLASHSTCPVCRANLAAVPAEPDQPTAENSGENLAGEEGGIRPTDHISIQVEEEREGLGRMAGMRSFSKRVLRPWRSRSARPAVGGGGSVGSMEKVWGEKERERFTLRLPEDVRKELVAGTSTLRRSASIAVAGFCGEESPRTGYSYREGNGGRSYRFGRSVRAATKSGLLWGFAGEAGTGSSKGKSVAPVVV